MRVQGPDGKVVDFPDDTPPEAIKAAMAKHYGGPAQPTAPVAAPAPQKRTAQNNPTVTALGHLDTGPLNALPSVGGFLGGAVGAGVGAIPGAIGGAALGGAAGEAAKEALLGRKLSPGRIASQGALEGGYQAVGGAIAKGAGKLARPLMRSALGVGGAVKGMVKMGSKQVADPVEEALARQVPVSAKGFAKAESIRRAEGATLEALIDKAKQSGSTVRMADVSKYARQFLRAKDGIPVEDKERVIRTKLIPYLSGKGKRVDPALLQDIKRYFADEAEAAYKAADVGNALEGQAYTKYAEGMAKGAREGLENLDPAIGPANARYNKISVLEDALRQKLQQKAPGWEVTRPGTFPMARALGSDALMSKAALKLAHPAWQKLYQQSPRLFFALLGQGDEPDATGGY